MWNQDGAGVPAPDPTGIGGMRKLWGRYVKGFRLGEPGTADPNGRPSPVMYRRATDGSDLINRIDNNSWPGPVGFPHNGLYLVGYSYFGNYGNPSSGAIRRRRRAQLINAADVSEDFVLAGEDTGRFSVFVAPDTVLGGEALYVSLAAVPEPASLALFGIGSLALLARRRRSA